MNLHDESLASLLHGLAVHAAARKIRFEVTALEGVTAPAELVGRVREFATGLDGVLISGIIGEGELHTLEQCGVRYVVLGYVLAGESAQPHPHTVRSVTCDNLACGRAAATWLLQRGHSRIGFFCERLPRGMYTAHWLDGYRLGHDDAELTADPELLHVAGRAFAGGEPAARYYAGLASPPTAFICPDARTASSFIEAMRAMGRTIGPENMVLGGLPVVATRYGLEQYPLLSEDCEAIAEAAVDYLSRVVEGTAPMRCSVVVPFGSANFS
jgi:DNA-binding LacI/PurR family transcriptional regulator